MNQELYDEIDNKTDDLIRRIKLFKRPIIVKDYEELVRKFIEIHETFPSFPDTRLLKRILAESKLGEVELFFVEKDRKHVVALQGTNLSSPEKTMLRKLYRDIILKHEKCLCEKKPVIIRYGDTWFMLNRVRTEEFSNFAERLREHGVGKIVGKIRKRGGETDYYDLLVLLKGKPLIYEYQERVHDDIFELNLPITDIYVFGSARLGKQKTKDIDILLVVDYDKDELPDMLRILVEEQREFIEKLLSPFDYPPALDIFVIDERSWKSGEEATVYQLRLNFISEVFTEIEVYDGWIINPRNMKENKEKNILDLSFIAKFPITCVKYLKDKTVVV